jgi:class 3 adenylate cyclase/tetratricopeptide (TPR) repeat protein
MPILGPRRPSVHHHEWYASAPGAFRRAPMRVPAPLNHDAWYRGSGTSSIVSREADADQRPGWVALTPRTPRPDTPHTVICPTCSTANEAEASFCRQCGTPLGKSCPVCSAALTAGARFCSTCGTPVADAPAASLAVSERRLVTVLFADLVGFTTISEARDSESTRELLSAYFEASRQVIERYGGNVEKFIGDAVMAVWGTPVAHEDDAERAERAALDVVERVHALGLETGIPGLEARAGVLTGEAAVTIGAQGQGMVAGDMVNTASRLQSVAPPGSVLVGEATHKATAGAIAYEPAADQLLKGKEAPVRAYRALRVIARRRGAGRSEQLEPPFVGRDAELRLLKDLYHVTSDEGRVRLVLVSGQAGIGKSRLGWELQKYLDGLTEVAYWHEGRCPAYGDGVTFWALSEMVRGRAGIAESEERDSALDKLRAMLADFVPDEGERQWIEPPLRSLLGLQPAEADDAGGQRETLFAAWRTLFERISERGTVIMTFEDLQWADGGLLDFIEHLLEWSRSRPIYVLTLTRPELFERRANWGAGSRSFTSLSLEPLPDAAMRRLLGGLVSDLPEAVVERILARADGIPLYAVETVRMLMADGHLQTDAGALKPVGDLSELAVPETLQALVGARLDALPAELRTLTQAASVLGKTFALEALAAVVGEESTAIQPLLRDLVRRELMVQATDPRSPERGQFGFVQAIIREVAYATRARRDRRRLHLAAARYFETLDDEEITGVLATHYVDAYRAQPEGPEGEAIAGQARIALRGAADRAARLGSYAQARSLLEAALEVAHTDAERAELHRTAGQAAVWASSDPEAAEQHLNQAVELFRSIDDREGTLDAIYWLAYSRTMLGNVGRGLELLEPAVTEYADLQETRAYAQLLDSVAHTNMRLGNIDQALEWCERALPRAERLGLARTTVNLLITRATALGSRRPREAIATLIGARELAAREGLADLEARALVNLAFADRPNDSRRVMEATRAGLELTYRVGLRSMLRYLIGSLTGTALLTGGWDSAIADARQALAIGVGRQQGAITEAFLLRLLVRRGEASAEDVQRVGEVLQELNDPQIEQVWEQVQAGVALADGRLGDAYAHELAGLAAWVQGGPTEEINLSYRDTALRCALWQRDPSLARAELALLSVGRSPLVTALAREAEAAIAAMDGRTAEAVAAFRDAARRQEDLGNHFTRALCQLTMVMLLGRDVPEALDAAEEARALFTELRAKPFLRLLDQALEQGRGSASPVAAPSQS